MPILSRLNLIVYRVIKLVHMYSEMTSYMQKEQTVLYGNSRSIPPPTLLYPLSLERTDALLLLSAIWTD